MSNNQDSRSEFNPNVIDQCMNDMAKVKTLLNELQRRYAQLEKRHFKILSENQVLKGDIAKFSTEIEQARKSKDGGSNDKLVDDIKDACEHIINDHDWEQSLAYDALLMYHNGVNKALLFGVTEVISGGGSTAVYLSIKEQLQNTCKDVAEIINIGTSTAFGYGVAKEITKDSGNHKDKEEKKQDHDETMGQT